MYQADTEILFPMRVAPHLRDLRGGEWGKLVDKVCTVPEGSISSLAFNLLLIRIASCISCHTHSYRAMRGCTTCAIQAVRRYEGTDQELLIQYDHSVQEVHNHLEPA